MSGREEGEQHVPCGGGKRERLGLEENTQDRVVKSILSRGKLMVRVAQKRENNTFRES